MLFDIDTIDTVLVCMIDRHLGNLVVSLSSVRAIIEHFQGKDVYLAVDSAYNQVVECIHGLDRVIQYPRREMYGGNILQRTILYFRFIKELRSTHSHAFIDLQGGNASSIMACLSGAAYRLSNSSARRSYLYNIKVDLPIGKHKVHSYTEIATAVGATIEDTFCRLQSTESRRISLNRILKLHGRNSTRQTNYYNPCRCREYSQAMDNCWLRRGDRLAFC